MLDFFFWDFYIYFFKRGVGEERGGEGGVVGLVGVEGYEFWIIVDR